MDAQTHDQLPNLINGLDRNIGAFFLQVSSFAFEFIDIFIYKYVSVLSKVHTYIIIIIVCFCDFESI